MQFRFKTFQDIFCENHLMKQEKKKKKKKKTESKTKKNLTAYITTIGVENQLPYNFLLMSLMTDSHEYLQYVKEMTFRGGPLFCTIISFTKRLYQCV